MNHFKTIKEYAQHLLTKVDFIDYYGRNVGLDYDTILVLIKQQFPKARTTKRALRHILYYGLDRSVRIPARYRSRKVLAREYAKSLLLDRLSLRNIQRRTKRRFGITLYYSELRSHAESMRRRGMKVPETRR